MKKAYLIIVSVLLAASCREYSSDYVFPDSSIGLRDVAQMLSALPIESEQLREVHDAVNSSSGNGYDEEYTMDDIFNRPGSGVGDSPSKADLRGKSYKTPLRDLIREYLNVREGTKSGLDDAQTYIDELCESGYQIYWPYSEDWDGKSMPIVTFDPGWGANSNYGYEIRYDDSGIKVVDSVYVDENVALTRPVWVVNRNNDSGFTPLDFYVSGKGQPDVKGAGGSGATAGKRLMLHSFKMLRNYDTWFAGASEFFVKCGSVSGIRNGTEEELGNYRPDITDFMIVVKRKMLKKELPLDVILVDDFRPELEKLAFLITEDDGGTTTSWKCSAAVKIQSKTYGFDLEIPYRDKDDIVWRGQLSTSYLSGKEPVSGRFGDVEVTFGIEE